ncbi:hypothetical protein [Actinomadura rubrisoli]|uniref:Uncharacterized protein n=1 Tax=Actinomadura rubrisoli TaxID=2530368 RepID=A0A4R5A0N0_9ACTN|nr:hypothetical protein [Actinomadura rubrisoli]TDD64430.1 hypothetical protein E1298_42410 [Actinomadura rubrisoli]
MPDQLIYPYRLRMQVAGFPPNIRDAANLLIMSLLGDPVPPDAKPFVEVAGHSSYELSNDLVTVYYTVLGDDTVAVNVVHPNT